MTKGFLDSKCQEVINDKRFGICDDPPPPHKPAYINSTDGSKWIAVINNERKKSVTFTAIDHCIVLKDKQGKMLKSCDAALTFDSTILFIELKESIKKGTSWIKDADEQLRSTIYHFEASEEAKNYRIKRAYIANGQKPKFKNNQASRMAKFKKDTGYILRIEARIDI